jgi:hypothetical protein
VAVEERLDLRQPRVRDPEARAALEQEAAAQAAPEQETRSPAAADSQASGRRRARSISPWAATTPPRTTAVSPGATSPTKAPVSRKAMAATSP